MSDTTTNESIAKAIGRSLPISTKHSVEIFNVIRNRSVTDAKKILEEVIKFKRFVPVRKYKGDVSHKKAVGPARYFTKASTYVLNLLKDVEANAQFKGLNTSDLRIVKAVANRAAKQWHYGRHRRTEMKRTNLEVVVAESPKKEQKK